MALEGFNNLMKNKMFLQLLSGAGAALQQGEPISAGINPTIQENITAKSQSDLLSKLLGGAEELGEGEKLTLDDKGVNINLKKDHLLKLLGEGLKTPAFEGPTLSSTTSTASANKSTPTGVSSNYSEALRHLGPTLGQLGYGDVAGLSPENIMAAFGGAVKTEELGQQRMRDIVDKMYKEQLVEESKARTEAAKPVFTIPGTDIRLTRGEYVDWYEAANKDERTSAIKNYEYAQSQGYEGSFEEFQDRSKTSQMKNYKAAVEDGYEGSFNEWMLEMAKAGSLNIGEVVERAKATTEVRDIAEAKTDVTTGKVFDEVSETIEDRGLDSYLPTDSEFQSRVEQRLEAIPGEVPQELEERVINDVRSRMKLEITDKKIRDKVQPSLKEGDRVIIARDEDGRVGWYIQREDGSSEFLAAIPDDLIELLGE